MELLLLIPISIPDSLKYPDSLNMRVVSRWKAPLPTFGIEVAGNSAYLSSIRRIYALDFSDPTSLALASEIKVEGFPIGLRLYRNRYLLAGSGYSGLTVVDVEDPYIAEVISSIPSRDSALSVDVKGRYAFVTDGEAGITVYDVSSPSSPRMVGSFDTPGFARGIHIVGNRAYVADGPAGLLILDITNPRSIKMLGQYSLGDTTFAIDVRYYNGRAYVAFGQEGLYVFDVRNPSKIKPLIRFVAYGEALGFDLKGNLLFIAFGSGGIKAFDLRRIENEIRLGRKILKESEFARYRPPIYEGEVIYDLTVKGNLIMAASRKGLVIYEYTY